MTEVFNPHQADQPGDSRSKLPQVVVGMFVSELTDLLWRHPAEEVVDEVRV